MSAELLKYVALQLLVLAGSLNEELAKNGSPALPLTFMKPVTPTNLSDLIIDAQSRVDGVQAVLPQHAAAPPVTQASAPVDVALPPVQQPVAPVLGHPPVAAAQGPVAPAAAPVAPVHPAAPPAAPGHLTRRRRDLQGAVSELADTVGYASRAVVESPLASVPGVQRLANAVDNASQVVERDTKTDATLLGEMLLS